MYYFNYYTLGILLIPGLLLSIYAEIKVQSTYHKYKQVSSMNGAPAHVIARMFLDVAGLHDIKIIPVRGYLSDYYNHRTKTIGLSEEVYNSTSIASIGIACHEVGHALQYKNGYAPIKIRNFLIPICNFANRMLWFLVILGLVFFYAGDGGIFIDIGVTVFALTTILNLVTLPVEFNASKRAIKLLNSTGTLSTAECDGVETVLGAAALTYVAAFVVSLLNLLRFIILFRDRD